MTYAQKRNKILNALANLTKFRRFFNGLPVKAIELNHLLINKAQAYRVPTSNEAFDDSTKGAQCSTVGCVVGWGVFLTQCGSTSRRSR